MAIEHQVCDLECTYGLALKWGCLRLEVCGVTKVEQDWITCYMRGITKRQDMPIINNHNGNDDDVESRLRNFIRALHVAAKSRIKHVACNLINLSWNEIEKQEPMKWDDGLSDLLRHPSTYLYLLRRHGIPGRGHGEEKVNSCVVNNVFFQATVGFNACKLTIFGMLADAHCSATYLWFRFQFQYKCFISHLCCCVSEDYVIRTQLQNVRVVWDANPIYAGIVNENIHREWLMHT